MSSHPLRSLFVNARGLSIVDFASLVNLLDSDSYDFIFVAETWFKDLLSWRISPYFLCHSPAPPSHTQAPRGQGGLLCLVSPGFRGAISSFSCSPYSITILLPLLCLHAVYLPPSLISSDIDLCQRTCYPPRTPAVLFGDFNCRFGKSAGPGLGSDTAATAPKVRRMLGLIGQLHHLRRIIPSGPASRTDHVYCSGGTTCEVTNIPPPVRTDHSTALSFLISTPVQFSNNGLRRFFLKHLEDPRNSLVIQQEWAYLGPLISAMVPDTRDILGRCPSRSQRQALVDCFDQTLVDACQTIAEEHLGLYMVSDAKKRPDLSL